MPDLFGGAKGLADGRKAPLVGFNAFFADAGEEPAGGFEDQCIGGGQRYAHDQREFRVDQDQEREQCGCDGALGDEIHHRRHTAADHLAHL